MPTDAKCGLLVGVVVVLAVAIVFFQKEPQGKLTPDGNAPLARVKPSVPGPSATPVPSPLTTPSTSPSDAPGVTVSRQGDSK
jgi:hypothetical protein